MKERLQKILSAAGVCSRRASETYITAGRITINGEMAQLGQQADPETDDIRVDGVPLGQKPEAVYLMLNKPQGVISATEDRHKKTVLDLIGDGYKRFDLSPVGRLDIDTEGFLLLTNDGALAHELLSPSKKVGKTYFVRLEKPLSETAAAALENGVDIGECVTKPARVRRICENEIELTITEGKFHQIKRMAERVGNRVAYLKRLAYGKLFLDESLPCGGFRELTENELELLYNK